MNTAHITTVRVKAKQLHQGLWLADSIGDLLIDHATDTRDGRIMVRCGYRVDDDSITHFYDRDEFVLVRV
jgi:hypothetical protein